MMLNLLTIGPPDCNNVELLRCLSEEVCPEEGYCRKIDQRGETWNASFGVIATKQCYPNRTG